MEGRKIEEIHYDPSVVIEQMQQKVSFFKLEALDEQKQDKVTFPLPPMQVKESFLPKIVVDTRHENCQRKKVLHSVNVWIN